MWQIVRCHEDDFEALVGIWERSVRASHDFLTEVAFNEIRAALVPCYFPGVDLYAIADKGSFVGFIGLSADTIEMLFIDAGCRNHGYGSALIDFAKRKGAVKVDVNEQNPSALKFYEAKGFRVIARDETDGDGRSYPILHLSL